MRKQCLVILIVVIFVACQEQGSKISSYDLETFVKAEGIVARDAIQSIIIEVRYSDDPDAVCDAVQKEIDKFRNKVSPVVGGRPPPIPPDSAEEAIRREAYQEYRAFLSSFDDAEDRCRNIANNRKLEDD